MTDEPCRRCHGSGIEPGDEEADVEAELAALSLACRERGLVVTPDGRISEATLAMLIGRSAGTVRNWRNGAGPALPHYRVRGRVTYKLTDIAAYLAASRHADSYSESE